MAHLLRSIKFFKKPITTTNNTTHNTPENGTAGGACTSESQVRNLDHLLLSAAETDRQLESLLILPAGSGIISSLKSSSGNHAGANSSAAAAAAKMIIINPIKEKKK